MGERTALASNYIRETHRLVAGIGGQRKNVRSTATASNPSIEVTRFTSVSKKSTYEEITLERGAEATRKFDEGKETRISSDKKRKAERERDHAMCG